MFGRFIVGVIAAAVAVNIVMMAFVLVRTLALVVWEFVADKVSPNPFRKFTRAMGPTVTARSGWEQVVSNALLAAAVSAYAVAFCENAAVDSPRFFMVLGFVALVVAQVANLKTKFAQARGADRDVAVGALAALPWAMLGAPVAWVAYVAVSLTFEPGFGMPLLGTVAETLSSIALGLGDWFLVRALAVGLFLLFAFQAATFFLIAPVAIIAMMRSRSAEKAVPSAGEK